MGTIVTRPRKDNTTAYMAKIVRKSEGKVIYRETETFDRRAAAVSWLARREHELDQPGALERAQRTDHTLADAIDKYVAEAGDIGRTKAQVLKAIKGYDIANMACDKIGSHDIVTLAQQLSVKRKPQTVANYLSHLGAVFAIARPAWNMPLDEKAMQDAFKVTRRLKVTGKSVERDRRPTLAELDQLMTHFTRRSNYRTTVAPMHRLIAFAIFSTRRQEEIARITWDDFEGDRVLVRDMKNPGDKIGNHVWCDLVPEAARIVKAMPKVKDRIFPYTADAISAAFTRACQFLQIEDLHFHDLRHDGVSRLFEMGWNIPHVAAVSGHRSWSSLKRYTHIRQTGDKYADWAWLDQITPPE